MINLYCPKCGSVLKENIQWSDPTFLILDCKNKACTYKAMFECSVHGPLNKDYTKYKVNIKQEDIDRDFERRINARNS